MLLLREFRRLFALERREIISLFRSLEFRSQQLVFARVLEPVERGAFQRLVQRSVECVFQPAEQCLVKRAFLVRLILPRVECAELGGVLAAFFRSRVLQRTGVPVVRRRAAELRWLPFFRPYLLLERSWFPLLRRRVLL